MEGKKCNIVLVKFKYAEYTGFAKKHAHDQQKKTVIKKKWQNIKNAISSVYIAVFGGYHPV